jgi:N-acetylglucosaminyldiphosphoundecaprenol N-acetyl-beta-D-mannosaminyltransferase
MNKYFGVLLEFNKSKIDLIISKTIENKGKGYVCSVEANNLTVANKNPNFCDGSLLAKILGLIHKKQYDSYIGADLFINYVKKKQYRQFFLGNTKEVLNALKENLVQIDPKISSMRFEELPFKSVHEFDYINIAKMINDDKPDIIWVSLGAPKQEYFMNMLLPHLNQGVMFGFGAIFNFYSNIGPVKRAPMWMRSIKMEWLYRAFEDPKKNVPRYWGFIKILPKLISNEYNKI